MSEETGLPNRGELSELPKSSIAVYAIRCVLRVQPLLVFSEDVTKEYKKTVIELARRYKIMIHFDSRVIDSARIVAKITPEASPYVASKFQSAHSALIAAEISAYTISAAFSNFPVEANSTIIQAVATSAADSATAAFHAAEAIDETTIDNTITSGKADYKKLREINFEVTDASETGPLGDLWYGSPPEWYIKAKDKYDRTIVEWEQELGEEDKTQKYSEVLPKKRLWKTPLAITGTFFLILAPISFCFQFYLQKSSEVARSFDKGSFVGSSEDCFHSLTKADTESGNRNLILNKSVNLQIFLRNKSLQKCDSEVSIYASTFKKDPEGTRKVTLGPKEKKAILWNISPTQTGLHKIVVQSNFDTITLGLFVKRSKYLTATQYGILTWIFSILGPMLTVPFWISFIQNRRDKKIGKETESPIILP